MTRKIIILGAGGHATSVANVAHSAGYSISYFIDPPKKNEVLLGAKVVRSFLEISNISEYCFALGIGNNYRREKIYQEFITAITDAKFPTLIHKSATISLNARIGFGSVLMPHAHVGPNSIVGKFCILNTQSSIDHDCKMDDYSSLAPRAVTGGSVSIGKRSALMLGACAKNNVVIGHDSILGANSYLNKQLQSEYIAYGTPAKEIRKRNSEDNY